MNIEFRSLLSQLLDTEHPGVFSCETGKAGHAQGIVIRCKSRDGYAFLHQQDAGGSMLLVLNESENDANPEVWSTESVKEIALRIKPWAFPPAWLRPAAIDRDVEKQRLVKLHKGLTARAGNVACSIKTPLDGKLTSLLKPDEHIRLEQELKDVDCEKIVSHFPWDDAGRLSLKTAVLLSVYDSTQPPAKDRNTCLAAIAPERRSDVQEIHIDLVALIVQNQSHNWQKNPWLWRRDIRVPESELLPSDWVRNTLAPDRAQLPESASEGERRAWCLELLDQGHIQEALSLYGVTMSEDVCKLLGGVRFRPPSCCSHPSEGWTEVLVDALRESAPWLLPKAVADEAERLKHWASQKKGRKVGAPLLRLIIFPGQFHLRKSCLLLTSEKDGTKPNLILDATASNSRLCETAWKRPIELDFQRYKIVEAARG